MTTFIAQNTRRQRDRIDSNGNIIDPVTKQILELNEKPYIPPNIPKQAQQSPQPTPPTPPEQANKPVQANPLAEMIKKQVNDAVIEALKGINIQEMVQKAIAEAFGGLK